MAKKISILIAAFATLQIGSLVRGDSLNTSSFPSSLANEEAPLYSRSHAIEILGSKPFEGTEESPQMLTQYVRAKVRTSLPKSWRSRSSQIARALIESANEAKMDPLFLMAVVQQESRFNPLAVGRHGEIGLMQIRPETARWLLGDASMTDEQIAKHLRTPEANIALGARYFAKLRTKFSGRGEFYISAYNMGAANVNRILAEGTRPEIYYKKVLARYAKLTDGFIATEVSDQLLRVALNLKNESTRTLVAR